MRTLLLSPAPSFNSASRTHFPQMDTRYWRSKSAATSESSPAHGVGRTEKDGSQGAVGSKATKSQ